MTPTPTPAPAPDPPVEVRRKLPVRGREDVRLVLIVTVLRDRVFLKIDPPLESDIAILDPPQIDSLIGILTWAARIARGFPSASTVTPKEKRSRNTKKTG